MPILTIARWIQMAMFTSFDSFLRLLLEGFGQEMGLQTWKYKFPWFKVGPDVPQCFMAINWGIRYILRQAWQPNMEIQQKKLEAQVSNPKMKIRGSQGINYPWISCLSSAQHAPGTWRSSMKTSTFQNFAEPCSASPMTSPSTRRDQLNISLLVGIGTYTE